MIIIPSFIVQLVRDLSTLPFLEMLLVCSIACYRSGVLPPAVANRTHRTPHPLDTQCIGSLYSWSIFNSCECNQHA